MIEILLIAVIGTVIAGLWDLKTTEVPDELAVGLVVIGVFYWIANWILTGDFTSLFFSLVIGSVLLSIGLILYKKGQWGGADAWILAAIGYMIPLYGGQLFIIPYILNFMIVSIVYTVAYAGIMGLMNPVSLSLFKKDLKGNATLLSVPFIAFVVVYIAFLATNIRSLAPLATVLISIALLLVFWRYAVIIEKHVFKKKIPVKKLRTGDVLDSMKWIGLTDKQVKSLKRTRKYVVIKTGVRFVPVFPITLLLTLLYGNLFLIVFG